MRRTRGRPVLLVAIAAMALATAGVDLLFFNDSSGDQVGTSAVGALTPDAPLLSAETGSIPVLVLDAEESTEDAGNALAGAEATTDVAPAGQPDTDTTSAEQAAAPEPASDVSSATTPDSTSDSMPAEQAAPQPESTEESAPAEQPSSDPEPAQESAPSSGEPAVGAIKSKADDKGYDVHGHVEHSVYLLGQQVLIPGQAATGGFIQVSDTEYMAYSPVTAMLPVAIQDNKEVLKKKPNLEGEQLYRRLAQEYTGSNDYRKLDKDAQRAINILTCTDWSLVDKRVRENTINHLLHSPISFGTIGSVDDPISTDVTIDLGYTHTRDKNWTEVEYMGNNVYKVTVVSNNNNGSHTGHAMGTAYVEMPAGTSLQEAKKIGNQMIPSKNKNNKLTIDSAARDLFNQLPRGASPLILFEHLSEEEQNAFFEGRGIETVGEANPDCNPLEGGILGSTPAPAEPAPEETPAEEPSTDTEAPADGTAPAEQTPAAEGAPAETPAEETPAEETPAADGTSTEAPAEGEAPAETPADESPPADEAPAETVAVEVDPAEPAADGDGSEEYESG